MKLKILATFIDETGEFSFEERASRLFGASFVFYELSLDIKDYVNMLNNRLEKIGFTGMVHTAPLAFGKNEYSKFSIDERKRIFNAMYVFTKRTPIKIFSIMIDKKYASNKTVLKRQVISQIDEMFSIILFHVLKILSI